MTTYKTYIQQILQYGNFIMTNDILQEFMYFL